MSAITIDLLKTKLLGFQAEHDKAVRTIAQLEGQLHNTRQVQLRLEGAIASVSELLKEATTPEAPASPEESLEAPTTVTAKGEG